MRSLLPKKLSKDISFNIDSYSVRWNISIRKEYIYIILVFLLNIFLCVSNRSEKEQINIKFYDKRKNIRLR